MENKKLEVSCRLGKTMTIYEAIDSGKIGSVKKEEILSRSFFLSLLNVTPKDYQKPFLKYFGRPRAVK